MNESVIKRINLVKDTDDIVTLKTHLCPFFEKGKCSWCITCTKSEEKLLECKEYYLERIALVPLDIWNEKFDQLTVIKREQENIEELVGIGINCNSCYMADYCPLYKENYVCGIKWDTDKPASSSDFMDFLINLQFERVKRSSVFEKADGGQPSLGLSSEMDRLSSYIADKTNLNRERFSLNVEATSTANNGSGILSRIFGGGNVPIENRKPVEIPEKVESLEDIPYEEVKEEKIIVPVLARKRK